MQTLANSVEALEPQIHELRSKRGETPLANDIFEAVDDWRSLAQRAIDGDTRVNFPVRARLELDLLERLWAIVAARPEESAQGYDKILLTWKDLLGQIEAIPVLENGHLDVLRILREAFAFLVTDYGFQVVDEQPMGVRFSSGAVFVQLGCHRSSFLSCSFGCEEGRNFWLEDLLYLRGDERYLEIPQILEFKTSLDVQKWFDFVASVFKRYGDDVLRKSPGIFGQLSSAQAKRDEEYADRMIGEHGLAL